MYSGCFEWNRTGSVTVESTQIRRFDLAKFLRNLQIFTKPPKSYIWFRLFWMEENRVCDGGEYTKLTWPNFYTTSKFMNMYSGCFEWNRTGSVTVECTQSWPGQIFTKPPQSHTNAFRLVWMEQNRVCDGGEYADTQSWPGQIFTKPPNFYETSKVIHLIPVVLNGREPDLWRWRVRKVELAKFYEEI
jgi:hypothetical protein